MPSDSNKIAKDKGVAALVTIGIGFAFLNTPNFKILGYFLFLIAALFAGQAIRANKNADYGKKLAENQDLMNEDIRKRRAWIKGFFLAVLMMAGAILFVSLRR